MHVLYLAPAYPPFPGGGERFVRSLALQLIERGHHVTVATSHVREEADFWNGTSPATVLENVTDGLRLIRLPVRAFPGRRPGLLLTRKCMVLISALPGDQSRVLQRLARYIPPIQGLETLDEKVEETVDLVHGFNLSWESTLVAAWKLAKGRDKPLIITPFAHFGATERSRVALNSTMDHQLRMMSESDAILTLTNGEAAEVERRGVAIQSTSAIGAGLDPLPSRADHTQGLSFPTPSSAFAIFVGRASYDKGALHAARSILALRREGTDLSLIIVGQSSRELNRFLGRLDHDDARAIHAMGVVSDREKHALLELSTMLLLPSRTDSFGIVILEAWAHGKPVIGARAGGIPEVIEDGVDGLLVNFGDTKALAHAISRLANDRELATRMGQRGREKVATEYSWGRVADKVISSYERVLAARRPRSPH